MISNIPMLLKSGVGNRIDRVLLHFDGANGATTTTDEYGNAVTLTGAATSLSTSVKKFGSAALTTGDQGTADVGAQVSGVVSLGSGWTIETQFRWTPGIVGTWTPIFQYGDEKCVLMGIIASSGYKLDTGLSSDGTTWDIASGLSPAVAFSENTWFHIAVTHDADAGAYYVYFEGVACKTVVSAATVFSPVTSANSLRIGRCPIVQAGGNGGLQFDEFRISDTCKYPGGTTFTPPASAFTS